MAASIPEGSTPPSLREASVEAPYFGRKGPLGVPPVFYLTENRRSTKAIHDFAMRFSSTDTDAPPSTVIGPDGQPVEIFTYTDGNADACRQGARHGPAAGHR